MNTKAMEFYLLAHLIASVIKIDKATGYKSKKITHNLKEIG